MTQVFRYLTVFLTLILLTGTITTPLIANIKTKGFVSSTYFDSKKESDPYYGLHSSLDIYNDNWLFNLNYLTQSNPVPRSTFISLKDQDRFRARLDYAYKNLQFNIGHQYITLNQGLLLYLNSNPYVLLDTRLLGIKSHYRSSRWSTTGLVGTIQSPLTHQSSQVVAGQVMTYPFESLELGLQFVSSRYLTQSKLAYSFLSNYYGPLGHIAIEYALQQPNSSFNQKPFAFSGHGSFSWGDYTISSHYVYYDQFLLTNLTDSTIINNGPLGIYQHTYTLLSRQTPATSMANQKAWSFQVDRIYKDITILGSYSHLENLASIDLYDDLYFQIEKPFSWGDYVIGFSKQQIGTIPSTFFIQDVTISLNHSPFSIQSILEYEKRSPINQNAIYNWRHELSASHSRWGTLSLMAEWTPLSNTSHSQWIAIQYAATLFKYHQLKIILGQQRAGKVCAGGICVYRPEFSGLDVRWTVSF
ncbi:hypothetical protein DID75_04470 [Candidatus Marinamargulisbacteria bacterium SCGC AG-410-N11]|nr:hypothetical protein DID75_04470 [Candidatus Marinamargulisbacteria bacterium SCGC AG-410-N11]